MVDECDSAIDAYMTKWDALVAKRQNKAFFTGLRPVAIGWKVADRATYDRISAELHDLSDKVVDVWMNDRWIAKFHLKDQKLHSGIEIIKLMLRRPGSSDPVGLDHIDYCNPEATTEHTAQILQQEPDLKWSKEENDVLDDYNWISIWFDGTEAKLKATTVIDNIIEELHQLNEHITGTKD